MVQRKINGTLDNPIVIHLYEVALPYFLVLSNKILAVSTTDIQNVATPYFFTIWVLKNLHFYLFPYGQLQRESAVMFTVSQTESRGNPEAFHIRSRN